MTICQIILACKLSIFDDVANLVSTSKWKQTLKTVSCITLMSSTEHCDLPWIMVFLLQITSIASKGTALIPVLILSVHLHNHNRSNNWSHMIFKSTLLELTQGTFRLTLQSTSQGTGAKPHMCHLALTITPASLKSLGFPLCLKSPPSHLSGKPPSFLSWKDCHEPHDQPRYQGFS